MFPQAVLLPSTKREEERSQCNIKKTVTVIKAVYPIYIALAVF